MPCCSPPSAPSPTPHRAPPLCPPPPRAPPPPPPPPPAGPGGGGQGVGQPGPPAPEALQPRAGRPPPGLGLLAQPVQPGVGQFLQGLQGQLPPPGVVVAQGPGQGRPLVAQGHGQRLHLG